MSSKQTKITPNEWHKIIGISQKMLQPLSLDTGQALHDRDHLPPGVLLIEEGSMRLLRKMNAKKRSL